MAVAVAMASLFALFALAGCSAEEEYVPSSKDPVVTTPVIGQEGVLRVGVNTGNPPLAGQTSEIVGIDVDVASALADEMGLKVEVVDVAASPVEALTKGTVDVVLGVASTTSDKSMWKSATYLPTAVALFATSPDAGMPTKGDGKKIASQASSMSAYSATEAFGKSAVRSSADLQSAFNELSAGTVDYVAADAIIGHYAANTSGLDVTVVGLIGKPSGYKAGVLASNKELCSQVKKNLKALSDGGVISAIEKKWLGSSLNLSQVQTVKAS
ncbi:MAG: transporter substrate-binding domain-containing protein [Coriobacteriia bacterium]|nr:transporter substrate-binding domain-containing protein [Coriobacteriia bacterium]